MSQKVLRDTRWMLAAAVFLCSFASTIAEQLAWDATSKTNQVKVGDTNSPFKFALTNISTAPITVNGVRTSCGCTMAKVPPLPWQIEPGGHGDLEVNVDIRGKMGMVSKVVSLVTSDGVKLLQVNVSIPQPDPRERNQMIALADRQAVFRNDCANCHAHPAAGKSGEPLYTAVCAICHESDHRASMVPDLKGLNKFTDADYWRTWITKGKPGSLMPAFAKTDGGPLTEQQIDSLVEYLDQRFRTGPKLTLGNPFE